MRAVLRLRNLLAVTVIMGSAVSFAAAPVAAQSTYSAYSIGVDVGWPNCGETIPKTSFGVVGVSDGLGYSENPCLASEASSFNPANLSLYVNTGWYAQSSHVNPSSPKKCFAIDEACVAYNYGYNAGVYAAQYAASQGITNANWWLDVETDNTWSTTSKIQNRQSLQGEYDALSKYGTVLGVYSTTAQWHDIVGDWRNNWPSWGATDRYTALAAATYCTGHEFTGGPSLLMQYTPVNGLDHDLACPAS